MKTFDAIIIGSGQGGTPLSKKLAEAGWKTALVEKKFIGGTCINVGCTPTKAMVASARLAYNVANSKRLGINISSFDVEFEAIVDRKNKIVSQFRDGSKKGLEETENLSLFFGEAHFTGNKELEIVFNDDSREKLTAPYIFIDTGGIPYIPSIEGIESVPYVNSTTILDLTQVPEHLLVVGANYIGCEFGQMFKRFGSNVTMLEHSKNFLSREDDDIANCLRSILVNEGINIHTNAIIQKVDAEDNGIKATALIDGVEQAINCTHILIATGRTPQTNKLALHNTAVETDEHGYIKVNEKLETTHQGIYAIGDVKGGPAFTHISYNDHIIIAKNLLEKSNLTTEGRAVPYCMFTDPQLGRIGLTEKDAKQKGLNYKVAALSMQNVARAVETSETKGMIKAIVDADTKLILGAAVIGEQGGEIMTMLQLAMMGQISYEVLKDTIFAHPLYAESLNNLFMKLS